MRVSSFKEALIRFLHLSENLTYAFSYFFLFLLFLHFVTPVARISDFSSQQLQNRSDMFSPTLLLLVTLTCACMLPLARGVGTVRAWRDARGLSCADYTTLNFCELGSYGPAWRYDEDKLFKHYADDDGFDAGDKCCDCVLSSSFQFNHLGCETRIETDNSIWYDSNGHTCAFYQDHHLCQRGGYGRVRLLLCICAALVQEEC